MIELVTFFIIVSVIAFLVLAFVLLFCFVFVRRQENLSAFEYNLNAYLEPYSQQISRGVKVFDTAEHKRVCIKSFDGLKLSARLYDNNSKSTIILAHGYRSTARRDFSCALEFYLKLELNVLVIDQRSHGESEGKLITFGVKESRDIVSWVKYLLAKDPQNEIFLSGLSMGASTVLFAAKYSFPSNVKGIIADCGFNSPKEIIAKVSKQQFKIKGRVIIPILDLMCRFFGDFSIYKTSTEEILKNNKLPILFIHGREDSFVPFEMSVSSFEAASGEKRLCIVDNADHGLSFLVDNKRVSEEISGFLKRYSEFY